MIFADSLRENAEENGFYFGNGEKILSPTLSLRETKQSKREGDAIRSVLVGFNCGVYWMASSWRFECKYRTAINEVIYTIYKEDF